MKMLWSVNFYDSDGDLYEKGVHLHLGEDQNIILKFKDSDELASFAREILTSISEIQ